MRSSSSTSLAHGRCPGSVRLSSPQLCSGSSLALCLLDSAAEQLMVRKDFRTALDTCEKGLESLCNRNGFIWTLGEQDEHRQLSLTVAMLRLFSGVESLKAALCIVGIQAMAELNQWQNVLAWVLAYYNNPAHIPAKILQMCILLYTKVGEPASMQEAGSHWLKFPANWSVAGFRTVAELYLLHILVPLGLLAEARELVVGEVGSMAFTEDQRQTALDIVKSNAQSPSSFPKPEQSTVPSTVRGCSAQRLEAVLRLFLRGFSMARASVQSILFQRALFAAVLLYLLLTRMDSALPLSFPWITRLLRVFRQMWDTMFGPYHQISVSN